MTENKSYRTQIIVALIGLIGVISAALITNWDKIFLPEDEPVIDSSGMIEQLFFQLDSIDVDKVRRGTKELSFYAEDPKYVDLVFLRLKSHLSLLRPGHDLKTEVSQDYGMCKEVAEKNAKKREEAYVVPLQKLIDQFERGRRKTLYQTLLNNRSLIFGRLIAADELCGMDGNGSYWKQLLQDSDEYFRELTINALGERQQDFVEDVLLFALEKPDLQQIAIYRLGDKRSKKAIPCLIEILQKNSNDYIRIAAYKALEKIDLDMAHQFQRPPEPKPLPPFKDFENLFKETTKDT